LGNIGRDDGVVGFRASFEVPRRSRRLGVGRRACPVNTVGGNIDEVKVGVVHRRRRRHRKDHPIANARQLAVADEGGAVFQEYSEKRRLLSGLCRVLDTRRVRYRWGRRPSDRQAEQENARRSKLFHGWLKRTFGSDARQAVENLWMQRAFPVNRRTAKFFLNRLRRDLRVGHLWTALSYRASLDRPRVKRRIRLRSSHAELLSTSYCEHSHSSL